VATNNQFLGQFNVLEIPKALKDTTQIEVGAAATIDVDDPIAWEIKIYV
jgi:hypothetical protein